MTTSTEFPSAQWIKLSLHIILDSMHMCSLYLFFNEQEQDIKLTKQLPAKQMAPVDQQDACRAHSQEEYQSHSGSYQSTRTARNTALPLLHDLVFQIQKLHSQGHEYKNPTIPYAASNRDLVENSQLDNQ